MPFLMRSKELLISGGQIEGGVIVADGITNAGGDDLHKVQLDGVFIKCLGKVAGKKSSIKPQIKVSDEVIMGGEVILTDRGELALNQTSTYNIEFIETKNININSETYELVLTTDKPHKYTKGANLFSDKTLELMNLGLGNIKVRTYLGYVEEVLKNTIKIKGMPKGIESGNHNLYIVSYPKVDFINKNRSSSNIIIFKKQ